MSSEEYEYQVDDKTLLDDIAITVLSAFASKMTDKEAVKRAYGIAQLMLAEKERLDNE